MSRLWFCFVVSCKEVAVVRKADLWQPPELQQHQQQPHHDDGGDSELGRARPARCGADGCWLAMWSHVVCLLTPLQNVE